MKKTESFRNETVDQEQQGLEGPSSIQSVTSTHREFPLRDYVLQSWGELGIEKLPHLDGNAGNSLGIGALQENKLDGQREIAAKTYSLDGITVLTNTLVEKVLFKGNGESLQATGIRLANGSDISERDIIVAAGAIRTPQVLMLSGIGPAEQLRKLDIPVLLDQPDLGSNLVHHNLFHSSWKLKDPSAGWAIGSANFLFTQPQYGWGTPADFVTATTVPKESLAAGIYDDEGIVPGPASHPLLASDRSFVENIIIYAGAADGSLVTFVVIPMVPTSRGSVQLASRNATDSPLIDPNYFATAVDRYVAREGVKLQLNLASGNKTIMGRGISRGTSYHPMGAAAMGKVVDHDLNVEGVKSPRIVDAWVFPVPISGHLQIATFAMAEQAPEIIYADRRAAE